MNVLNLLRRARVAEANPQALDKAIERLLDEMEGRCPVTFGELKIGDRFTTYYGGEIVVCRKIGPLQGQRILGGRVIGFALNRTVHPQPHDQKFKGDGGKPQAVGDHKL